ncbi:hypothetical protein [Thermanaerovibrio acidaminovorans]|uniref:hypothetical protein n=1 Tax=Thermanaerovibrio acidaminovorans TaxID=81462 RepID=UPI002492745F|nr:hypothetical protein [Thermanaerovibrio acidaminovorans]
MGYDRFDSRRRSTWLLHLAAPQWVRIRCNRSRIARTRKLLLEMAQRIAKDQSTVEAEIRHGSIFLQHEKSDYTIISPILTLGEKERTELLEDQRKYLENYLAKEITLAVKEFGFDIEQEDMWCKVESFRILEKPFRPMRFCKEPQYAASEIRSWRHLADRIFCTVWLRKDLLWRQFISFEIKRTAAAPPAAGDRLTKRRARPGFNRTTAR